MFEIKNASDYRLVKGLLFEAKHSGAATINVNGIPVDLHVANQLVESYKGEKIATGGIISGVGFRQPSGPIAK